MENAWKIALVYDSAEDREYLERLVKAAAEKNGEAVRIRSFPSAEAFLFAYEEEKDFALLFLDIELDRAENLLPERMDGHRCGGPGRRILLALRLLPSDALRICSRPSSAGCPGRRNL